MKRFWFIIAAAGLIAGMNADAAAPFYKVQCYDANDKLVNCDDIAKIKKHTALKKNSKLKIAKAKKAAALALTQKKAREKAIALRELSQQNEELKAEMQALRKANLLAAAKTEEKPADTAQLASATTVIAPTPISTTQVAAEPAADSKSPWSLGLVNWTWKSFQDKGAKPNPFTNELDITVTYSWSDYSFSLEDDPTWNWTANNQNFAFGDIQPILAFNNIYTSPSKETTLTGDINAWLGTSADSRDEGMIATTRFRLKLKTKINEGNGWFRFDTFVTPVIRKYSTKPSTGSLTADNTFESDGNKYEKLDPYSRVAAGVKMWFHHKIIGSLDFQSAIKFQGTYTYADEYTIPGTGTIPLVDARWNNVVVLDLPRLIYTVSDSVTLASALIASGPLSTFKPFSTTDGNNLQFEFRMTYDI